MKKKPKHPKHPNTIGIVSDLHCGSQWGLFPPKWVPPKKNAGAPVEANVGQKYLWEWWMWHAKTWSDIVGGEGLDLLVINGDAIEGKQPRPKSTGLITADLQWQADIAYECMKPFVDKVRPKKIIRTVGTGYHEQPDNPLPALDARLGINSVDEEFNIKTETGILQVQHNPGSGGAIYKGTIIDREILWSIITAALGKAPDANIIVRSHLHYHHTMMTHGKTFVLTPGWQLQTPYARKRNRYRWTPDIGGVLLTRDDAAYCGYQVRVKDVPLPGYEREAVSYETL